MRQEMSQQREELLREMELLKTELMGKLHVCMCVNVFMGMCGIIIVHMCKCVQGRREDTCVSAIGTLITELWQQSLHNHATQPSLVVYDKLAAAILHPLYVNVCS